MREECWINMERQEASNTIQEQSLKVEDILVTIKKKKWTYVGHVKRRTIDYCGGTDNRRTASITEWKAKNCKTQERKKTGEVRLEQ